MPSFFREINISHLLSVTCLENHCLLKISSCQKDYIEFCIYYFHCKRNGLHFKLPISLVAQLVKNPPVMQDTWIGKFSWRRDRLFTTVFLAFPCGSDGKEAACNMGDLGSIPGLGRSPGGGHGNPLQYSCLENPMDRGAWQTTVHRVANSRTRLKWLSTHAQLTGIMPNT